VKAAISCSTKFCREFLLTVAAALKKEDSHFEALPSEREAETKHATPEEAP
jgi:hypothetical protein